MGHGHPERPARIRAISDQLISQRLADFLHKIDAPVATTEQFVRVHDRHYIDHIIKSAPRKATVQLDLDTLMNPHSLDAALHAAGALIAGLDSVLSGEVSNAFCAVRPPEHHAEHDRAMGFCLFNNVAVGAAHALSECGLERVAIVDFDVHHGNGTEDIFEGNDQVLFCSTYQYPFYPFSQPSGAATNIIHCPLPAGSDGELFRQAVTNHWLRVLQRFQSQMLLVSAGFDGHRLDPLAQMQLTEADYQWITERIMECANEHCEGCVVSTREGGYDLEALAHSVAIQVRCLMKL
ncbi:MAG: histone deacetylase family protein [Betaproteobacteria bacterium]|nr:MAG: histone deacetylase family protein [Betaproteobacteria bacterium]